MELNDPITLAFVTLGFFRAGGSAEKGGLTDADIGRFEGEIGAVQQCANLTGLIELCEETATNRGCEYPGGVFAYDLAEPLGEFLRKWQGDDTGLRLHVAHAVAEYFADGEEEASKELAIAMCATLNVEPAEAEAEAAGMRP